MEISPEDLEWRDSYKLLTGSIVPRPIGFVSTISPAGLHNLAAFSFFNGVCPRPFIVSFAPMQRGNGEKKDTLRNIEDTGEFVINVVSEDIVVRMNETAPEFASDVDEFVVSGLTPIASSVVKPPRVLESPINMECELVQVIHFGDEPGAGSLVLGKVVRLHVRDDLYFDGKIDSWKLAPVARLAGDEYCKATDRFRLKRPSVKA
ncbi:MAG: hypothetical protein A2201_13175 [Alicyclobacillus sp. RIFOXYA1_FULL_53_8]|nr:MAG: hypothetical protein A2201_13175 [Alicyclobacillus sp. RIFOXYA1_FULL_53_8]